MLTQHTNELDSWLTVSHTGRLMGKSEGTIRRLGQRGELRCVRLSSGARVFNHRDIQAALEQRRRQ